jgi:hypothetical protein
MRGLRWHGTMARLPLADGGGGRAVGRGGGHDPVMDVDATKP